MQDLNQWKPGMSYELPNEPRIISVDSSIQAKCKMPLEIDISAHFLCKGMVYDIATNDAIH